MTYHRLISLAGLALISAGVPAVAANFTTAAEVKPILQATKPNWIAVRLYEGQDLLYFTNLLSWRCGLDKIEFSVNGGAMQEFKAEPCYEDAPQPNALKAEELGAILVSYPPNTIETIDVKIQFDDGGADGASYERGAVEIQ